MSTILNVKKSRIKLFIFLEAWAKLRACSKELGPGFDAVFVGKKY